MADAVVRAAPREEQFVVFRNKLSSFPVGQGFHLKDTPWRPSDREYELGVIGLQNEIKDFFNYIKPTYEEQHARELVVSRIKDVVLSVWPTCKVDVFGSFKTGLYLPTSDIDMVIFGKWDALPLHTLERALSRSGISSDLKVLDKATVPIVKMTDKDTGILIDISFNMVNSVRAADLIQAYIKTFPCLPPLVFVLKQFLLQRSLNEVWTGGLSSYALILMVVRFLQDTVPPGCDCQHINLGTLLLEFFELYGRLFNYSKTAIRVTDGGQYVRKEVVLQNMAQNIRQSMLCIEDPLCPGNDVGRRSYQVLLIKQAFEYAYVVLSSAVLPQYHFLHGRNDMSILGRIIRVSEETTAFRQRIQTYGLHMLANPKANSVANRANSITRTEYVSIKPTSSEWPVGRVPYILAPTVSVLLPHNQPPQPVLQPLSTYNSVLPWPSTTVSQSTGVHSPNFSGNPSLPSSGNGETARSTLNNREERSSPIVDEPISIPSDSPDSLATVESQDKPGECTVLAENFASLSTLMSGERQENSMDAKASNHTLASHVDRDNRKRRCLRPVAPSEPSAPEPKQGDTDDTIDDAKNRSIKRSDTDTFTHTLNSNRPRKHGSKATRQQQQQQQPQQSSHVASKAREDAPSYSTRPSTSFDVIPSGQKRSATGSRRFKH
ncbi:unnamed protein product [Dicrocoelium dendriticum]|nr:unnamed protein product [Dicrocoelium dendriticum]